MNPRVSAVIVNFNTGPLLERCIDSLLASTIPLEVWVVDNHSTDASMAPLVARSATDERLHLIHNERNVGFSRANNQALRQARGDKVLLLNPDCRIEPDTLSILCDYLDAHPGVGMVGALIVNPDGSEQAGCRRRIPTPWLAFVRGFGLSRVFGRRLFNDFILHREPLPAQPIDVEAISGAFMLMRRSDVEEVGFLDEGYFLHCEDLDLCVRFQQAGRKIVFVPGVRVLHEKGASSKGRPIRVQWHMHRGMIRFYKKFFRHEYPAPLMWLVIVGVWLRFSGLAMYHLLRRVAHLHKP